MLVCEESKIGMSKMITAIFMMEEFDGVPVRVWPDKSWIVKWAVQHIKNHGLI